MAGQTAFELEGGMSQPSLVARPSGLGRTIEQSGVQPHHGVLGLLVAALIVLYLLDRLGFRFAVTAGKR